MSVRAASGSRTLIGPSQAGVRRRERPGSPKTCFAQLREVDQVGVGERLARAAEAVSRSVM